MQSDKDVRKYQESISDNKNKKQALTKKQSENLMATDLGEVVYDDKNNLKED